MEIAVTGVMTAALGTNCVTKLNAASHATFPGLIRPGARKSEAIGRAYDVIVCLLCAP